MGAGGGREEMGREALIVHGEQKITEGIGRGESGSTEWRGERSGGAWFPAGGLSKRLTVGLEESTEEFEDVEHDEEFRRGNGRNEKIFGEEGRDIPEVGEEADGTERGTWEESTEEWVGDEGPSVDERRERVQKGTE